MLSPWSDDKQGTEMRERGREKGKSDLMRSEEIKMEFSRGDASRAGLPREVADPSDGDVFESRCSDIEIMRAMLEAARHKSRSPPA